APGSTSGSDVSLRVDGIVPIAEGHYIAIFGYNNAGNVNLHATTSVVSRDDLPDPDPQPAPPTWLLPGDHPGAFLPAFDSGQTKTWQVDGRTVSASASDPTIAQPLTTPIGTSGYGVQVGDTFVVLRSDPGAELAGAVVSPDLIGPSITVGAIDGHLDVS